MAKLTELNFRTHQLILYRNIIEDEIIQKVRMLLETLNGKEKYTQLELENRYYEIYSKLVKHAEREHLYGELWKNYVITLIVEDENVFSLNCEKSGRNITPSLMNLAMHDIKILKNLYMLDWQKIKKRIGIDNVLDIEDFYPINLSVNDFYFQYIQRLEKLKEYFKQEISFEILLQYMMDYYYVAGCGDMARYAGFYWNGNLVGIADHDPIQLSDLIGYDNQKEILIKNTETFIKGKKANNVLLYGDRGTGKSSSVKALLNKYAAEGLRMIELSKYQLGDFSKIIRLIRQRGQRFIIFMDDLSFEDFETEYKHIKALIEGGLETKPENVLIYVTSNRKHLISESWKDRESAEGEVRITDSVHEKLSLADRFGITITYLSPNQVEYLQIVQELARKNGIKMSPEILRKKAVQWEMTYHGRSGRTAQQFIDYLLGMM